MEYEPNRVIELIETVSWEVNSTLRLFWVRHQGSRTEFVNDIEQIRQANQGIENEVIVPLILRENLFLNSNALLSDAQKLFEINRDKFVGFDQSELTKVTVLIIAKSDFRMTQCSSPIILPNWFPVMPGQETYFTIADLGRSAETELLACVEARIDHISELFFALEQAIVNKLDLMNRNNPQTLSKFFLTIGETSTDFGSCIAMYIRHLNDVQDSRAYRPNAAGDSKFLSARFLRLALNNSPKVIAQKAKDFSECFTSTNDIRLKPTLFALMFSPAAKMDIKIANWHAIILAFYQGYQLMNGGAHCGEYPKYSIALQYANSINLREFYVSAKEYIDDLV